MSSEETSRGTTGTQHSEERSPEEIRAGIEETREELADTVEALAAKTDVKARAQAKADETKAEARGRVMHAMDTAKLSIRHAGDEGRRFAKGKPGSLALAGGVLVGLLVAWRIARR